MSYLHQLQKHVSQAKRFGCGIAASRFRDVTDGPVSLTWNAQKRLGAGPVAAVRQTERTTMSLRDLPA